MSFKRMFLFLWIALFRNVIASDVKTWRTDTNFANPKNWENGRVPCSKDRVIFSSNSPVVVFMPDSLSVSEMVLPQNGELVFPKNGLIDATSGSAEESCTGKDAKFQLRVDSWFDPRNWNITSSRAFPQGEPRRNAAVPHAYQVPCATDTVHFPANASFQVHDITTTANVAFLHINNVQYGQEEFDTLMNTATGKLLFPSNPQLRITRSTCTDESGCICGNEDYRTMRHICKFEDSLCPEVNCYDPVEVTGHCCPICGAKIIANLDRGFRMDEILKLIGKFHKQSVFRRVESFTTKTKSGEVQSIFVDDTGTNKDANDLAQRIYDLLMEDTDGSRLYKILHIEISKSTSFGPNASGYYGNKSGMSSGGVAAIVIVLLSIGSAMAVYFYRKREITGFSFARFDARSDRFELELGTTPHDELQPGDSAPSSSAPEAKSKGFDNPVYGTSITEESSSVIEELSDNKNFVENPMFEILSDPTN